MQICPTPNAHLTAPKNLHGYLREYKNYFYVLLL